MRRSINQCLRLLVKILDHLLETQNHLEILLDNSFSNTLHKYKIQKDKKSLISSRSQIIIITILIEFHEQFSFIAQHIGEDFY